MDSSTALRYAITSVPVPGAPPRQNAVGAAIGLSFLDSALRLNHIRRLSETLTVTDHRVARRTTEIDVSLAMLDEGQRRATVLSRDLRSASRERARRPGPGRGLGPGRPDRPAQHRAGDHLGHQRRPPAPAHPARVRPAARRRPVPAAARHPGQPARCGGRLRAAPAAAPRARGGVAAAARDRRAGDRTPPATGGPAPTAGGRGRRRAGRAVPRHRAGRARQARGRRWPSSSNCSTSRWTTTCSSSPSTPRATSTCSPTRHRCTWRPRRTPGTGSPGCCGRAPRATTWSTAAASPRRSRPTTWSSTPSRAWTSPACTSARTPTCAPPPRCGPTCWCSPSAWRTSGARRPAGRRRRSSSCRCRRRCAPWPTSSAGGAGRRRRPGSPCRPHRMVVCSELGHVAVSGEGTAGPDGAVDSSILRHPALQPELLRAAADELFAEELFVGRRAGERPEPQPRPRLVARLRGTGGHRRGPARDPGRHAPARHDGRRTPPGLPVRGPRRGRRVPVRGVPRRRARGRSAPPAGSGWVRSGTPTRSSRSCCWCPASSTRGSA